MKRLLAIGLAALLLLASVGAAAAAKDQFNEKFTFAGVTLSDGTATYENAIIEAGSKRTGGGSTFTSCGYYTTGYTTYLGYYQDGTFASSDPAEVEAFCLSNFANRTP